MAQILMDLRHFHAYSLVFNRFSLFSLFAKIIF